MFLFWIAFFACVISAGNWIIVIVKKKTNAIIAHYEFHEFHKLLNGETKYIFLYVSNGGFFISTRNEATRTVDNSVIYNLRWFSLSPFASERTLRTLRFEASQNLLEKFIQRETSRLYCGYGTFVPGAAFAGTDSSPGFTAGAVFFSVSLALPAP